LTPFYIDRPFFWLENADKDVFRIESTMPYHAVAANRTGGMDRRKFLTIIFTLGASVIAARAVAEPVRIVAFGDSNTAGFRVFNENAYPAKLERALRAKGYDVSVLNSGISGDTSSMGLSRVDRAVPQGTDIAIVYFGRNDLRWGVAPEKLRANIDAIVTKLRVRNIKVLLIGLRTFDLSQIAVANGALYYPDFFAGVSKDGDKDPRYTLILDPIQHLNSEGYSVVVSNLLPIVESMLNPAQQQKTRPRAFTQ
jgi:acyl-CoA thioesterase I